MSSEKLKIDTYVCVCAHVCVCLFVYVNGKMAIYLINFVVVVKKISSTK